ncbi:redox-regulated ATPase YchF [Haloplasma contractile]|uniref:Ribosome-binding ATPase YchF n=1 Tax=Haloplasma contractile SSD-17B TaxID=1033810 RepID=U2EF89_9MOLU|nr:redox-regulated ATPase YchF [Haloplasma contractile]ERJ13346.1 GTP-binding protein YchF [Haloplasma contractile SSD-17B]
MALTAGIVGLPNVGKSTLFNAITQAGVEAANYPFATIDPNVGVVEVPDERLDKLTELVKPKKTIPTTFEFTDIAGLVRGASKGEGLGNQFLSHIRQVDAICQVVRCFVDDNITHVDGEVEPIRDIETINFELILADMDQIDKRLKRIEKQVKMKDKQYIAEFEVLAKIKVGFENEVPARSQELSKDELEIVKHMQLLTLKPMLYVANVSEDEVATPDENPNVIRVKEFASQEGAEVITVCAKIESEIVELDEESKEMFLEDLGITESGLDKLIRAAYDLLGLETYFTAGEKEVRAWTFIKGMTAPQCAGIIHTDFQKGFIRAETVAYKDLVQYGSEQAAKEAGKVRLEGKDYIVKDGDVMHFRFNV